MNERHQLVVDFAVNSTVTTKRKAYDIYREWQANPDFLPEGVVHRPIYDFRPGIILLIIEEKIRQASELIDKVKAS
jgi:hypothetical protein